MGEALCTGLIRIHVKNAANLNTDWLYATLKFNHPELIERLKAVGYHGGPVGELPERESKSQEQKQEEKVDENKEQSNSNVQEKAASEKKE